MSNSVNVPGTYGPYSHRPIIWGLNQMVGAGTQLTAQTGMRIMNKGGNAVDAAVASALTAGVLEPTAHYTLGGEVAFLFYDAENKVVRSIVGQGWAPKKATVDYFMENFGEIPAGVLSTTVPGVISALLKMLKLYGTMSFHEVVADALNFAQNGFPSYQLFSRAISSDERMKNINKYPETAKVFLPDGKPPEIGDLFIQKDLYRTLSLMEQEERNKLDNKASREEAIDAARDVYYKGDVAKRMVDALVALGAPYTYEDFSEYESPEEDPISVQYRGYTIYTNQTWTQGITLLQALKILEGFDLGKMGHNSAEAIHVQVEALKLAFADREKYVGDPYFVNVPVKELLSEEYCALRRKLIHASVACASYPPGDPINLLPVIDNYTDNSAFNNSDTQPVFSEDGTTYLATIDSKGNMVSATPSSFSALAQGMILGDTGILINCRGCYFWLDPENPNCIEGHKRPRTTPCTFIILKDNKPYMTLGTPGGDSQPQSNLQVFTNIVDFGLDVQEAVEAPRYTGYSFPRSPWPHKEFPNRLDLEGRISDDVLDELKAKGHIAEAIGPWGVRNGFTPLMINESNGVYLGGADPRKESVVLGW
jgi:gamma-glutamyltranspeptidase/glutathione hydrolase